MLDILWLYNVIFLVRVYRKNATHMVAVTILCLSPNSTYTLSFVYTNLANLTDSCIRNLVTRSFSLVLYYSRIGYTWVNLLDQTTLHVWFDCEIFNISWNLNGTNFFLKSNQFHILDPQGKPSWCIKYPNTTGCEYSIPSLHPSLIELLFTCKCVCLHVLLVCLHLRFRIRFVIDAAIGYSISVCECMTVLLI